MSSPKAVAKHTRRPPAAAKPKAVAVKLPAKPKVERGNDLSAKAIALAAEIEQAFAKDDNALSVDAMHTLMGALCRVYSVQVQNGASYTPIEEGQVVNPTAVMITASGLLRAANLAVFELGMWHSYTGR
jgi:hypothetical protein